MWVRFIDWGKKVKPRNPKLTFSDDPCYCIHPSNKRFKISMSKTRYDFLFHWLIGESLKGYALDNLVYILNEIITILVILIIIFKIINRFFSCKIYKMFIFSLRNWHKLFSGCLYSTKQQPCVVLLIFCAWWLETDWFTELSLKMQYTMPNFDTFRNCFSETLVDANQTKPNEVFRVHKFFNLLLKANFESVIIST